MKLEDMAYSARTMMERGFNTTATVLAQEDNGSGSNNATKALIDSLVFAQSKSIRTSTIILASFNVLASLVTAGSILYDCYWASKRCNPKFKASKFCVSSIHPAETFPLVLSIGIIMQGFVFAFVQGHGLTSLFTTGCTTLAQIMWPALFIVPYIQVVFGLECALRSLRTLPFQARGKYDVTICGGVVVLMLMGTWIPSFLVKGPDQCFASLVWFVTRYGEWAFVLLLIAAGLMIISAVTIFIRLSKVTMIDQHQRIAASRMVYYLVLGIVSLAFIIPFFGSLVLAKGDLKAAMISTVVLNLSGLMSGLLQLFLRSNTATTSFGPKIGRHWERTKHEIRLWGPNELAFNNQLNNPVSQPQSPQVEKRGRSESRTSLIGMEKVRSFSMESISSPPFHSPQPYNSPSSHVETKESKEARRSLSHSRKQSQWYSLFPSEPKSPGRAPEMSVYDISQLAPPALVFGKKGHKRDSSIASSATVQIGLRLSHAPLQSEAQHMSTIPLPSTTYNPAAPFLSPIVSIANTPRPRSPLPSPLKIQTTNNESTSKLNTSSPQGPFPVKIFSTSRSLEHSPVRTAAINKMLPPTPTAELAPAIEALRVSTTQLTPAVYSPATAKEKKEKIGLPSGPKSCMGEEKPRKDWI